MCMLYFVLIESLLLNFRCVWIMKDPVFRRNLDHYQSSHLGAMTAVDADCSNGELTIDLPPQTGPLIKGSFGLIS